MENLSCEDFEYYRAYIERQMYPGYSTCGKCQRPWKFVKGHSTRTHKIYSCFPLCEKCWHELKTPENRMPYYRRLWLEWDDDQVSWKDIELAVKKEGTQC